MIQSGLNPAIGLLLENEALAIGASVFRFIRCIVSVLYPLLFSVINTKGGEEYYGYSALMLMGCNCFGVVICLSIYIVDIRGEQRLEKPYKEAYEERADEEEKKFVKYNEEEKIFVKYYEEWAAQEEKRLVIQEDAKTLDQKK